MGKRIIKQEIMMPEKKSDNSICESNYILVNNKLEKVDYICNKSHITKIPFIVSNEDILNINNINSIDEFKKFLLDKNNFIPESNYFRVINCWIYNNIDLIKQNNDLIIYIICKVVFYKEEFKNIDIIKIKKLLKKNILKKLFEQDITKILVVEYLMDELKKKLKISK